MKVGVNVTSLEATRALCVALNNLQSFKWNELN